MAGGNRRKCKCCRTLFRPDPCNRHHQRYCSEASCRAASKAASQARWRSAPENQGYFRGPESLPMGRRLSAELAGGGVRHGHRLHLRR
jgi:hypothetical protein